ncbi:hypothetical protein MET9862_05244 [Methylobacterium symbioticum]|uniref:CusB-like beta-barrel domain-containing protein n=1 Tax=Methylobacterium symbioticum TaxID=2584084 RepID=A0A509EKB7_9HYPH|nr:hypothetical protein MET9862_05244 [Methylobacterium symbioticum]
MNDPAALELEEGGRIAGRVRRVYPEVDRATRLGKVRIALTDDPRLRIGAFARGTVEMARRRGVAVPVSSLLFAADGRVGVLAVKDGHVEARTVETGLTAGGFAEIRSGLAEDESVVARAGSFLRDGDRVRPVAPDAVKPLADAR